MSKFFPFSNKFVPDTVSHMNFFKRYLFKKALLEDELANEERRKKEAETISKQPEPAIIEPPIEEEVPQPVVIKAKETKSGGEGWFRILNDKDIKYFWLLVIFPLNFQNSNFTSIPF